MINKEYENQIRELLFLKGMTKLSKEYKVRVSVDDNMIKLIVDPRVEEGHYVFLEPSNIKWNAPHQPSFNSEGDIK